MGRSCKVSCLAWLLALGTAGVLAAQPASAQQQASKDNNRVAAATNLEGQCYATRAVEVYIPMSGGTFEVAVVRHKVTVVTLPSWVQLERTTLAYDGFEVEQRPHQVVITPLKDISDGAEANVAIKGLLANPRLEVTRFEAVMHTRLSEDPEAFSALVDVKPLPDDEYEHRRAAARALAEQEKRDENAEARLEVRRQTARTLLAEDYTYPAFRRTADDGDGAHATIGRITWLDAEPYMRFELHASTYREHELTAVEIRKEDGDWLPAEVVMADGTRTRDGVLAIIEPNGRVEGIVLIPDEIQGDTDKLSLQFHARGTAPIVAAAQRFDFVPVPPEEIARRERAKQSILSIRGLYGAFWIADGEGNGELDATSVSGLGLRFVKGINKMFAVELQLMGGRTGTARFQDVMVDGTQGTLTRSATLGRAQFGGSMRFGDKAIPYLNVGLGVQGASFDGQMTSDGGTTTEMDSAFQFTGFITFGGGVEYRFSDHFVAGATLTAETPLGGSDADLLSISLGAQLGYGW